MPATYPGTYLPVVRDPALPDVLIIGDSISIGYTPYVRTALANYANVHRVPENGMNSDTGLTMVTEGGWLSNCRRYKVIVCNWGLHDLQDPVLVPSDNVPASRYTTNLAHIFKVLAKTNAQIIWATTTYIPASSPGFTQSANRSETLAAPYKTNAASAITTYNATATKTIQTVDLYTASAAHHPTSGSNWYDGALMPHFLSAGYSGLGTLVANAIKAYL